MRGSKRPVRPPGFFGWPCHGRRCVPLHWTLNLCLAPPYPTRQQDPRGRPGGAGRPCTTAAFERCLPARCTPAVQRRRTYGRMKGFADSRACTGCCSLVGMDAEATQYSRSGFWQ
eukprot:scaffold38_cov415-Prasinococcus_capsulatus_cf.AAC.4